MVAAELEGEVLACEQQGFYASAMRVPDFLHFKRALASVPLTAVL